MQKYEKADIVAILGSYHHGMVEIRDNGIWLSQTFAEGNFLDELNWKYAVELDWPDAPNPLSAPNLPIPFSANELAAFMLAGIGVIIPETYLNWNQGLDENMLHGMGVLATRPREAMRTAYTMLRDAEVVVGEQPQELEQTVDMLGGKIDTRNGEANTREGVFANGISNEEYRSRRAKAKKSTSALENSHAQAKEDYRAKFAEWRKAMVRHLVRPPIPHQDYAQSSPAIVLPPGTRTVDVIDIPSLIAETLYCHLLAEGRLPTGTTALSDDAGELLRNVQLYKLTVTHSQRLKQAIQDATLETTSKLTHLRCGVEDMADAYVTIDGFTAYVAKTYNNIEVRVDGAQLQEETNRCAHGGNGFEVTSPSRSLNWSLKNKSAKRPGYSEALYSFLESAQSKKSRRRPTASDVVDEWHRAAVFPITSVDDGIVSFENANGVVKKISETRHGTLDAIRKAISRMTASTGQETGR